MMNKSKPIRPPRKRWVKIIWGIVKFTFVPVLCLLALFVGLVTGYVYLGKQPLYEVWSMQTWQHIYDLVFATG